MKEKTQVYISLVFSIIAISLSVSSFYMEWWHEESKLSMKIIEFGFGADIKNNPICTTDVALFNYGNKDSALLRVTLHHEKVKSTNHSISTSGVGFFPVNYDMGFTDIVLSPGKIRRVELTFQNCTAEELMARTKSEGANLLYLRAVALGYRGETSRVDVAFARTLLSEQDALKIPVFNEGQFDLMGHGKKYRGEQIDSENVYSFMRNEEGILESIYVESTTTPWSIE
ncbi:hypothetical protein [Marinobacter nauticus]|uniref:hypothetical protein n=1 Tax=Marinobacter nauticus TaxID=2743 RepID=UPI001C9565C2|nr:hypothetical protein [Marinobacter nauticus]MBY6220528.1 hypothetical protein [Marinobacter nauticus]